MQDKKTRIFLAIDLPENIKKEIINNIKTLQSTFSSKQIRWVKEKNLHLTLIFLGNINSLQLEDVDQKVINVSEKLSPFIINLTSLEVFPSHEKPIALAFKIKNSDSLEKLVKTLKKEVSECGIELEKREFNPHVTVGRINKTPNIPVILNKTQSILCGNPAESICNDFSLSFKITEIKLFESKLNSNGSIYTPIANYKLKKNYHVI